MIERKLRVTAWLGVGVFVGVVLLQHAASAELRPHRHVISEYANTDAGSIMGAGFVAWAVGLVATSLLVLRRTRPEPRDRAGQLLALCLMLAAAGATVTAIFETQAVGSVVPPGTTRTAAGRLHDAGSGVLSVALLLAGVTSVHAAGFARWFRRTTIALMLVAVVVDVALLVAGDPVPGVRQRVLVAAGCGWQVALIAQLSRVHGAAHEGSNPASRKSPAETDGLCGVAPPGSHAPRA
ncbi:MAG: DUF998 domain-containing protein [Actinomycetota bacterium]|nr:DUF998 domain-containing protein [Actinomycetota bacterium]